MPTDKSTERLTAAEESFRSLILEQYDLEPEFVSAICGIFSKAAGPLAEASALTKRARASSSKPKKSRKKSAYNVFVREMMKTGDIKELDHKQKMGAIAKLWKELDLTDRSPYADMATEENTVASPPEESV